MLAGGVLPGFGHARPHLSGGGAAVRGVCGGFLVLVSSLQAPGTPFSVSLAFVSALQVAMVYRDEQVVALLLRDRPVRGGGG